MAISLISSVTCAATEARVVESGCDASTHSAEIFLPSNKSIYDEHEAWRSRRTEESAEQKLRMRRHYRLASISKRFLCSTVILVEPTDDSVTASKGSGKLPANLVPAILNEWVAGVNGKSGGAGGKNKASQNECLLIENITTQRMARSRPNIVLKTE